MLIKGVLLGTYAEQVAGGDQFPITPAKVKIGDEPVRVTLGFAPDTLVGHTTRIWHEDGRILFEAEVAEDLLPHTEDEQYEHDTAAIGIRLEQYASDGTLIRGGPIFEVGLTGENENQNQPPWEIA
jgi:hypothetical protein